MARPMRDRPATPNAEQVQRALNSERGGVLSQFIEIEGAEDSRPGRDTFITHSSDSKGQHGTLKMTVPSGMLAIGAMIVQSGKIPQYKTVQDIGRDGYAHRLWDVVEGLHMGPDIQERLHAERMDAELERWQERLEYNTALVEKARAVLNKNQNRPGFDKVLEVVKQQALGMDHPWRGDLLEVIAEYEQGWKKRR